MPECKLAENLKDCSCTYMSCNKRGLCCECVKYHRAKKEIPGCFFSEKDERCYDRSIRNFLLTRKGKENN